MSKSILALAGMLSLLLTTQAAQVPTIDHQKCKPFTPFSQEDLTPSSKCSEPGDGTLRALIQNGCITFKVLAVKCARSKGIVQLKRANWNSCVADGVSKCNKNNKKLKKCAKKIVKKCTKAALK